jgi:hypothetical protein
MLFLLAIESLHRLVKKAREMGMLSRADKCCETFRISLYADAAALFIKPTEHDLAVTNNILAIFAEASGLITNLNKTKFYPIQCDSEDMSFLTSMNLVISTFPCKYLGLPLHYRKSTRSMMQPLINEIANRLSGWKRNLFSYPGRETLVKSIISAMPTHFLAVFKMKNGSFS